MKIVISCGLEIRWVGSWMEAPAELGKRCGRCFEGGLPGNKAGNVHLGLLGRRGSLVWEQRAEFGSVRPADVKLSPREVQIWARSS